MSAKRRNGPVKAPHDMKIEVNSSLDGKNETKATGLTGSPSKTSIKEPPSIHANNSRSVDHFNTMKAPGLKSTRNSTI